MTAKNQKELFTAKDFAKLFGKKKQTIQYQLNNNNIEPVKKDGTARLYDYDAYEFLAAKYINASKKQNKINDELPTATDKQTALSIKTKLDLILKKLDVDTANEVMTHIDNLIHDKEVKAADEYLNPYLDKVTAQNAKINQLLDQIEQQNDLIKTQTETIKTQTVAIKQLQKDAKEAKSQFKKMSWVDTKKVIDESWKKLTDEQRKEFLKVLPLSPKATTKNRGVGEAKLP